MSPIEIAVAVIWQVKDTAKAVFEVDNYKEYLSLQCDAALRNIVRISPYDVAENIDTTGDSEPDDGSLRGSSTLVAERIRQEIQDKVADAGLQRIQPVTDFPLEDWNQILSTILTGTFLMTKHCLPSMKEAGFGRVITISSGHGRRPDKYKSAYVAAKHGQIGFTNTVAMEKAKNGITANCILPDAANTCPYSRAISYPR